MNKLERIILSSLLSIGLNSVPSSAITKPVTTISKEYSEIIKMDDAEKVHDLGMKYYKKGKYELARGCFTRVIELNPAGKRGTDLISDSYDLKHMTYYDEGKLDDAIAEFTKQLELRPERKKQLHCLRGNLYYEQGNYRKALPDYEECSSAHPTSPQVNYTLGEIFERLGEREKAKKTYEKLIGIKPKNDQEKLYLAQADDRLEKLMDKNMIYTPEDPLFDSVQEAGRIMPQTSNYTDDTPEPSRTYDRKPNKGILWLGNLCLSKTPLSFAEGASDYGVNRTFETFNSRYGTNLKNAGSDVENSMGVSLGLAIGPLTYQFITSDAKVKPRNFNNSFTDSSGSNWKTELTIDFNLKAHEFCYNFGNWEDDYDKVNGFYYGIGGGIGLNTLTMDSSSFKVAIDGYSTNPADKFNLKEKISSTSAVGSAYVALIGQKIDEEGDVGYMGLFGRLSYNTAFGGVYSVMAGITGGSRFPY